MDYLRIILNNALYFSLLLIIVSSVISVFFIGRKRDRCLKDMNKFMCSLYMKNGKEVFGTLRVFGTGVEFEYENPHLDSQGHQETSFIFYSSEFSEFACLKRFHQKLSDEDRKRRNKDIRVAYRPNAFRIARRKIRNFLSTFQDGITRSLNTVIGIAATKNPKSNLSQTQKDLSGLGAQVVSVVSNAYDPILENYIGHFVVLEIVEKGVVQEYCGILKDYTQNFIEILNVVEIESDDYQIQVGESIDDRWLNLIWNSDGLSINNSSDWPIYINTVYLGDSLLLSNQLIEEKSAIQISLVAPGAVVNVDDPTVVIELMTPKIFDMVVPRTLGLIRHGCPRDSLNLETFLGTSASKALKDALHSQFIGQVNAQKPLHPEGRGYQD